MASKLPNDLDSAKCCSRRAVQSTIDKRLMIVNRRNKSNKKANQTGMIKLEVNHCEHHCRQEERQAFLYQITGIYVIYSYIQEQSKSSQSRSIIEEDNRSRFDAIARLNIRRTIVARVGKCCVPRSLLEVLGIVLLEQQDLLGALSGLVIPGYIPCLSDRIACSLSAKIV